MVGIYKIVNKLTGDCYIGSSLKLKDRKNRHFKDLNNGTHHSIILQRAVDKYKIKNFEFQIIEECLKDELLYKEQFYINSLSPKYNICKVAGSPLGTKQSEESCEKRRKYALENGIIPPESTWKDKQEEVLMLDYNTLEILNKFPSLSEACRFIGKDCTYASTISSCCKNKRYSAFGYRWVFKKEDISNLRTKKEKTAWNKDRKLSKTKGRIVCQYDLEGNFIKEFGSIKEAELEIGKGVGNCARGISKTSHGYVWKYKEE